ncbi:MAG TPA: 50S ribosomal protein L23 [Tepidisphaeraceae bacterium]|jgi:large subunit ribosomal protein L23|nr:50S ribosomal protein L23 [Tepidisphaeraceae bacterium]
MDYTNVIIKPLVTEKSTHLQESRNVYAFQVAPAASKTDVRRAIEAIYNVKVIDVRTMNRKGKPRRSRFKMAKTSDWKRAIVTLEENSRIELY